MRYLVLDLHFSNGMFRLTAVALSYSELKKQLSFFAGKNRGLFLEVLILGWGCRMFETFFLLLLVFGKLFQNLQQMGIKHSV